MMKMKDFVISGTSGQNLGEASVPGHAGHGVKGSFWRY
jgi:hypothetical protein